MASHPLDVVRRLWPAIASIVLILVTLSPVLREPADDGYPLSTYPMFAFRRPTKMTMDYAYGLAADGTTHIAIRPRHVGSSEVLQARATIANAVRGGQKAQQALCDAIAKRVVADPDLTAVASIRIVTGTHDAVEYLVRHKRGAEIKRFECKVPR